MWRSNASSCFHSLLVQQMFHMEPQVSIPQVDVWRCDATAMDHDWFINRKAVIEMFTLLVNSTLNCVVSQDWYCGLKSYMCKKMCTNANIHSSTSFEEQTPRIKSYNQYSKSCITVCLYYMFKFFWSKNFIEKQVFNT